MTTVTYNFEVLELDEVGNLTPESESLLEGFVNNIRETGQAAGWLDENGAPTQDGAGLAVGTALWVQTSMIDAFEQVAKLSPDVASKSMNALSAHLMSTFPTGLLESGEVIVAIHQTGLASDEFKVQLSGGLASTAVAFGATMYASAVSAKNAASLEPRMQLSSSAIALAGLAVGAGAEYMAELIVRDAIESGDWPDDQVGNFLIDNFKHDIAEASIKLSEANAIIEFYEEKKVSKGLTDVEKSDLSWVQNESLILGQAIGLSEGSIIAIGDSDNLVQDLEAGKLDVKYNYPGPGGTRIFTSATLGETKFTKTEVANGLGTDTTVTLRMDGGLLNAKSENYMVLWVQMAPCALAVCMSSQAG